MYDWPEVRHATDRLWAACREALRGAGIAAPEGLERGIGPEEGWRAADLVLGQACGLPLVRGLRGRVALIGAADYGLPGCPPGWYRSELVVRSGDRRETLEAFRGATAAVNGLDSQSGCGSLMHLVAPLALGGRFFGRTVVSGAHAASARMVAEGEADLAAIDAVSWRLIQRFRPAAGAGLRVLISSDPTPGLPLIAAPRADVSRYRGALAEAMGGLDAATRAELGVAGFVPLEPEAYELIENRLAAAEARLRL